jgi:hypothetical protein
LYDEYLAAIRDRPIVLLELGVANGESLKTFSRYFENGRITGSRIRLSMTSAPSRPDRLEVMHVHKSMVVLRKARHADRA